MNIEYDHEVDAAYISLRDIEDGEACVSSNCVQPEICPGEINLDFDDNGRLLGLEILNASLVLPQGTLK